MLFALKVVLGWREGNYQSSLPAPIIDKENRRGKMQIFFNAGTEHRCKSCNEHVQFLFSISYTVTANKKEIW